MIGVSLATMLIIASGAALGTRSIAQRQALDDAERITERLALMVGPLLPAYLSGDQAGTAEFNRTLANRKNDGNLLEITIWAADGRILYSDTAARSGAAVSPPPEVARAITGRVSSGFESGAPEAAAAGSRDVSGPGPTATTASRSSREQYVEVYVPLRLAGEVVAFEAYYDYAAVDRVANRLRRQTLPVVLLPLLMLQLIQIPIAISLARRLKRHENDRARLLERALSSSDHERVRFAADLHDGPIQDLAGISYVLAALAPRIGESQAGLMSRVQEALQRAIQSLRGLMTDLYPPDLHGEGLEQAVRALAEPLEASGVHIQIRLAGHEAVEGDTAVTLYRVIREALVNVHKHAQATAVTVFSEQVHSLGQDRVRIIVEDDGIGIDPVRLDRRAQGHLGLLLVSDRVASLGGELTIESAPGSGTRVEAVLPILSAARRSQAAWVD
jgi:two-component system NarL family sensor kinase